LCVVGCSQRDTSSNVLALVDVDQWNPESLTRGQLIRVFGKCGYSPAEKEALLYQYTDFPWKKFDTSTIEKPSENRPILTGYTFNVDPIGCRDVDDVFTIGEDGYFYITIADVSEWFKQNTGHSFIPIASNVGQTLYAYGQIASPMLPFEKECSLLQGEERYGVSMRFRWTGTSIEDISFLKTKLVNTESFNYESIYSFCDSLIATILFISLSF
jgi:exoribonuclease R